MGTLFREAVASLSQPAASEDAVAGTSPAVVIE